MVTRSLKYFTSGSARIIPRKSSESSKSVHSIVPSLNGAGKPIPTRQATVPRRIRHPTASCSAGVPVPNAFQIAEPRAQRLPGRGSRRLGVLLGTATDADHHKDQRRQHVIPLRNCCDPSRGGTLTRRMRTVRDICGIKGIDHRTDHLLAVSQDAELAHDDPPSLAHADVIHRRNTSVLNRGYPSKAAE
jgi:hypothetical protein